jgi:hypothetical protein
VRLAFGIMFLWIGAGMVYSASRGMEASTPWGAFQTILTNIRGDSAGGD